MGSDTALYDVSYTAEDFTPVARLTTSPMILIANKESGISSVQDLLEKARKAPGKINVASSGNGVITHLGAVEFMQVSQTKLMNIPFKRSEESSVGRECVSTCRSRRSPYH